MSRSEKAHAEMVGNKYNCAQCVLHVFEDLGLDQETALKITRGFGGGMGGSGGTCGAVTAAYIAIGLKLPFDPANPGQHKKRISTLIAEFNKQFNASHGSLICRELKAAPAVPSVLCPNLCKTAVEILEGMF
jgi:C_GCAxxG_C_C family probable redox protein